MTISASNFEQHLARTKRAPRLDLNPSAAERWIHCTASPGFILANADKLPPDGSKFTQEGTTAHEVAAAFLQNREPDPANCPTPIDEDMRLHAWNYMEYVEGLREKGASLLVEQKMPLWYMPGRNCIVDSAIVNPNHLHIVDYKYGAGVVVSPERNLQGTTYAYNIAEPLKLADKHPITVHIYQPRGRNSVDSPAHIWETTWGEIKLVALDITLAANMIQDVAAGKRSAELLKFRPSEKTCKWCPFREPVNGVFCAARQKWLAGDFEDLTLMESKPLLPAHGSLSVEQRHALLTYGKEIKSWIDGANEDTLNYMTAGNSVPGFKLVMSRGGNRYWTNPVRAAKVLTEQTILQRDEVIEEKVKTPAQIEKLLGKNKLPADIMELIGKPAGVPEIAPVEDKREALGNVVDEFDVIADNEP